MVRAPFIDDDGWRKGAWSSEEDAKLIAFVLHFGYRNWRLISQLAGLRRNAKSCRLRWVNYLKPGVKRGNFSKHEEDLIVELHSKLGNKWSAISAKLPGRTDNEIKNFWHGHIVKRYHHKKDSSRPKINKKPTDRDQSNTARVLDDQSNSEIIEPPETTQNEPTSSLEDPIKMLESSLPVVNFSTDPFPVEIDDYIVNDCILPFLEEDFMYSDYGFIELSSFDSCSADTYDQSVPNAYRGNFSTIENSWISEKGNFWNELFVTNAWDSPNGSDYVSTRL